MKLNMKQLLIILLLILFSQQLMAKTSSGESLSLAALMIKDQHFHRSQEILDTIDTEKKNFDFKRYHTLQGITALHIGQYDRSITNFNKAIALGKTDEILYVYMSQAAYRKGDYASSVRFINQAPSFKSSNKNLLFMKFDALKKQNHIYQAWDVLKEGESYFPAENGFIKQQVFMLIELGYYQAASKLGLEYVNRFNPSENDYIAIGIALSKTHNYGLATRFLEVARLRFPNNDLVSKALANNYSAQKKYYIAAKIMEHLAIRDPSLLNEAAELNKLSHQYFRALFLNSRSTNQAVKLQQRLALFLAHEDFEQASLMEKDLQRNKLLKDDRVRYALAYAHFRTGKYQLAEQQFSQITNSRLFNKANKIRAIMLDCQDNKWKCM